MVEWYEGDENEVFIPKSFEGKPVTTIRYIAFRYKKNVTKVHLPDSITNIQKHAFLDCINLETITGMSNLITIGEGAFIGCEKLKEVTIPNVITIGNYAFSGCYNLKSIGLIPKCKSIGLYSFEYTSLDSIVLPENISSIKLGTFYACESLKSITIPSNIKYIDSDAFRNCTSLVEIYIPISVIDVGSEAFKGCSNLTIYCERDSVPSPWGWGMEWDGGADVIWGYKDLVDTPDNLSYRLTKGI